MLVDYLNLLQLIYKLNKHLPDVKVSLNYLFWFQFLSICGILCLFQSTCDVPHFIEFLFYCPFF